MLKKVLIIQILFFGVISNSLFAQVCGTDIFLEEQFKNNPKAKAFYDKRVESLKANVEFSHKSIQAGVKIIPVVFHVIHQYGSENIAKSVIDETVAIMNSDWRKQNEFITSITNNFSGVAADCEIEFRLATKDPNGNCTQGITRTFSTLTEGADDNVKSLIDWPNTKYLNIWVVKSIDEGNSSGDGITLGYAYYPDVMDWNPNNDGIVVRADALGGNSFRNGRTMTHEVGHYLGLPHTFNGSCGGSGDGVSDTPPEDGVAYFGCDYGYNPCGTNLPANIENFMSYASCQKMFTSGQKGVVDQTFIDYRSQLVSSSNNNSTGTQNPNMEVDCKPIADFSANNRLVCQGETVNFSDLSFNGNPTAWSWTFTGGTPANSGSQNPQIVYNTPGIYNVSMTASNDLGQTTETQTQYLEVVPNTAENATPPYLEGFESNPIATNIWSVENPNNNITWGETSSSAATGSRSLRLNNVANSNVGEIDAFISNTYNFAIVPNLDFSFKVAYKQKVNTDTDVLKVFFSTNCGKTWTMRYSKQGASLATAAAGSGLFIPNTSQWRQELVNVSANIKASSNVRFKFEFTSGGGNSIYIDDINIAGSVGLSETNTNVNHLNIFPNPAFDKVLLSFYTPNSGKYLVEVLDVLGRIVFAQTENLTGFGDKTVELDLRNTIVKGVYSVKISGNNYFSLGKLIKE